MITTIQISNLLMDIQHAARRGLAHPPVKATMVEEIIERLHHSEREIQALESTIGELRLQLIRCRALAERTQT